MHLLTVSAAIRDVVIEWAEARTLEAAWAELASPDVLAPALAATVRARVHPDQLGDPSDYLRASGFVHLTGAFEIGELEATPEAFFPIPVATGTVRARAAMLAFVGLLGLEAVSYKSENNGELFVNLVTLPGEGIFADKSRNSMHGHTDAVSFPPRGYVSPISPEIGPSPDVVCLAALRNPENVPTTVMPLHALLAALSPDQIAELKIWQFSIRSQRTFAQGTKRVFGEELVELDAALLMDTDEGTWIRHSHSSVDAESESGESAVNALNAACAGAATQVALQPGDLLIVSNRTALHGRAEVGGDPGGTSRWLIRGYGLNTVNIAEGQRYAEPPHMLFP
jgi:L-asparagine oxygenase